MIYPFCQIENISGDILQLHEKEFEIDELFTIPDDRRTSWSNNDDTISAITNGLIRIHNSEGPIDSITKQIDYLKNVSSVVRITQDGVPIVRSDSRPMGTQTYFSMAGDSTGIGDGTLLMWDFSNNDDLFEHPNFVPPGYKAKKIHVKFLCPIYLKDGRIFYYDAPWGSYISMFVGIPAGSYYPNPAGSIPASALGLEGNDMYAYTDVDLPYYTYIMRHMINGSNHRGIEFNAEGASVRPIPVGWQICGLIVTPESDNISKGFGELEVYRCHTCLLPGQTIANIHS